MNAGALVPEALVWPHVGAVIAPEVSEHVLRASGSCDLGRVHGRHGM